MIIIINNKEYLVVLANWPISLFFLAILKTLEVGEYTGIWLVFPGFLGQCFSDRPRAIMRPRD